MCWHGRTESSDDILDPGSRSGTSFRLPIFDYGEKQMHKTSRIPFAFCCSDNRKSKIQNRKWGGSFPIPLPFVFGGVEALAQQPKKVPRIGYLSGIDRATESARSEAIR